MSYGNTLVIQDNIHPIAHHIYGTVLSMKSTERNEYIANEIIEFETEARLYYQGPSICK